MLIVPGGCSAQSSIDRAVGPVNVAVYGSKGKVTYRRFASLKLASEYVERRATKELKNRYWSLGKWQWDGRKDNGVRYFSIVMLNARKEFGDEIYMEVRDPAA